MNVIKNDVDSLTQKAAALLMLSGTVSNSVTSGRLGKLVNNLNNLLITFAWDSLHETDSFADDIRDCFTFIYGGFEDMRKNIDHSSAVHTLLLSIGSDLSRLAGRIHCNIPEETKNGRKKQNQNRREQFRNHH